MVSLLTMTGGASLTGAWVYKRWGNKKQRRQEKESAQAWWQAPWRTVQATLQSGRRRVTLRNPPAAPVADERPLAFAGRTHEPNTAIHYGLRTSALALGVTTAGWLIFPPLQIAGLPLLLYLGVPPAQAAYDQLWVEGRPSRALAETVVLAVCLASGYYWVGALSFWLYYGSRTLLAEKQPDEGAQQQSQLVPTTTHVWQDGAACAVPTATLQPGDQVVLHSGELAPVDGLIIEGVAWLRPHALSAAATALRKAEGDRVEATDLVVVGRICVRVLKSSAPTGRGGVVAHTTPMTTHPVP